jgi:hypothetical protein
VIPSALLLLLRITFLILGLLYFYMSFRIDISVPVKNDIWDFDWNCIGSVDRFQYYSHFHCINSANP